jgi:hypothetical protein
MFVLYLIALSWNFVRYKPDSRMESVWVALERENLSAIQGLVMSKLFDIVV